MEPISTSIGFVAKAAVMVKSTADAIESIKRLVKGDNSLSEKITAIEKQLLEAWSLVLNSQQVVMDLQNLCTSEREEKERIRKELGKLKSSLRDVKKYELFEYVPGVFVFAPKSEHDVKKKSHCICANCATDGEKSILQTEPDGRFMYLVCHRCSSRLTIQTAKSTWVLPE
ncbi:hypothetical protein KCE64_005145 [Salmonella enterica subsp. enterica serovar Hvittingfoss]|nr:hypothetical protein [Salmonella enterica subsp. enterica serovar Hvittingfoss]EHL2852611.1 hypothetical protein [Salmonella enterica subsp. enterica serovar Hvittingfoss]